MLVAALTGVAAGPPGDGDGDRRPVRVEAWIKSGPRRRYETRLLRHLRGFDAASRVRLGRYGGRDGGRREKASGSFRTQKIDGRWWIIDPDGLPFIHVAMNSVGIQRGPQFRSAFREKFGDELSWARATVSLLKEHGYNGTGRWSRDELLGRVEPRMVYTPGLNVMADYGKSKGIVRKVPGHHAYPHELIPVFDPGFASFCEERASALAALRDDPFLLGYLSDNELQLPAKSLDRHLTKLAPGSPGRSAAEEWLARRRGGDVDPASVTDADRDEWLGHVMETYFSIVGDAIRKHDPNHMYLGCRFHGRDTRRPALWRAAGRHLDAISVNVYGNWTPTGSVRRWVEWSGKPVIATEFYAKGQDSGLPNRTGAGWTVRTQAERGYFYQNFTLGLIESRGCVGWHYFKYADNDPTDTKAEASNRDSNKGVVKANYEPWSELLDAMKEVNTRVYDLADYFDTKTH